MSGVHYTTPEAIKIQLGQLFGFWDFEDIVLSNYRRTDAFGADVDMIVDATYRGVKHSYAYKRISVTDIFKAFPYQLKPVGLPEAPTAQDVADIVHARLGVELNAADIDMSKSTVAPGKCVFTIADASPHYYGTFTLYNAKTVPEDIDRTSDPIHRWPLAGNGKPSVGTAELTATFDYEVINGVTWAGLKTDRLVPLGVSLKCVGEYTLRFKVLVTAMGADSLGLFTNAAGDGQGRDVKIAKSTAGKYYPYVRGTIAHDATTAASLNVGEEAVVTIRGYNDNQADVYINNRMVIALAPTIAANTEWTHFGRSSVYLGPYLKIRDIEYYDHAVEMPPVQVYTKNDVTPLTQWNLQPWYLDNASLDARNVAMVKYNPSLQTYPHDYTKYTSFLKTIPAFARPWNNVNDMTNATYGNALVNALKDIDGGAWQFINATNRALNLYRCCVVYNGPTKDCRKSVTGRFGYGNAPSEWYFDDWIDRVFVPPNMEYDNVVVIWLKSTWENNEGYGALVMLHYNNEV